MDVNEKTQSSLQSILTKLEECSIIGERTRILTLLEETIRVFTMLEKDPEDSFSKGLLHGLHTAVGLITGEDE